MAEAPSLEPHQLVITTQVEPDAVVVQLAGELDMATAPQLRTALHTTLASPTSPAEVRVDLGTASFIDAASVGVLIEGRETARRTGVGFSIQNPTGVVRRVLDILGLAEALHVEPAPRTAAAPPMPRPGSPPR